MSNNKTCSSRTAKIVKMALLNHETNQANPHSRTLEFTTLEPVVFEEPSTSYHHPLSTFDNTSAVSKIEQATSKPVVIDRSWSVLNCQTTALGNEFTVDDTEQAPLLQDKSLLEDFNSDDSIKDPDFVVPVERRDILNNTSGSTDDDGDIPLSVLRKQINLSTSNTDPVEKYTKKGEKRKRKRFEEPLSVRKKKTSEKIKLKYSLKSPCGSSCKKQCRSRFTDDERQVINTQYWQMTFTERRNFISSSIISKEVDRHRGPSNSRRQKSHKYFFKISTGHRFEVCKTFFLSTLGYNKNNDRIIQDCCSGPANVMCHAPSKQGKHTKTTKIDRDVIKAHVESFHPAVSHYRREHAPNKRYLPSDTTIQMMYSDFKEKCNNFNCSYEVYRSVVSKEMNISFTKLGNEECEACESFQLHNPEHTKENPSTNCDTCTLWKIHVNKADEARSSYRVDKESTEENVVYFSGDLQKVIMLPRIDMFKKVVFCPRIIVFNLSCVPLGKKQKRLLPVAVLWHEALAGRQKEDIISAYYQFFREMRDCEKIVLWVDNCSSQNKNWALFSFLIYIVNSAEISTTDIVIKYFEPGHTFMSADSFHHQVELSMKKTPKMYDFKDFVDVVQRANSKKVKVITAADFYEWEDYSSGYKLKKQQPRVYIKDIVQIRATRGKNILMYKKSFLDVEEFELNFLKSEQTKNGVSYPKNKKPLRGITENRKNTILKTLSSIMPEHRLEFWRTLPINDAATDLINNIDE